MKGMTRMTPAFVIGLFCMPLFTTAAAPLEFSSKAVILRVERVGPEALGLTAVAQGESFVRVVARAVNGKYLVAVNSNAGILRMQGAYLDSALAIQDGLFTYYHPNGRMESEGRYVAGIKSGPWVRYAIDGARLTERNYTGLTVDELIQGQPVVGASANADVSQSVNSTVETQRRQITPVQF
ncbi:MAG: toxin-antitoxin system YwqK family antitoxin [Flavobacteriales bacterium]